MTKKLILSQFKDYLKPRPRKFHKGNAGHVVVIGGDYGYSGAVRLAAEAALRVGAGLVSVATREEHALTLNIMRPEIMCHAVATTASLQKLIKKATALIVGPGLGKSPWARKLLKTIFSLEKPLVVDADALNLLAEYPIHKNNWILTPHPGEAARLLIQNTDYIQGDRLTAIKKIQSIYGGVCVLKGAGTLVRDDSGITAICSSGNPGMATAGMGDVLSGVIGGLVSQGIPLTIAAQCGVVLHAEAGDLAAKEKGERGLLALDLMPYLQQLVNP